jgi:hypothetical protein
MEKTKKKSKVFLNSPPYQNVNSLFASYRKDLTHHLPTLANPLAPVMSGIDPTDTLLERLRKNTAFAVTQVDYDLGLFTTDKLREAEEEPGF